MALRQAKARVMALAADLNFDLTTTSPRSPILRGLDIKIHLSVSSKSVIYVKKLYKAFIEPWLDLDVWRIVDHDYKGYSHRMWCYSARDTQSFIKELARTLRLLVATPCHMGAFPRNDIGASAHLRRLCSSVRRYPRTWCVACDAAVVIQRAWQRRLRRRAAAVTIQRAWMQAMYDPDRTICKKMLARQAAIHGMSE